MVAEAGAGAVSRPDTRYGRGRYPVYVDGRAGDRLETHHRPPL